MWLMKATQVLLVMLLVLITQAAGSTITFPLQPSLRIENVPKQYLPTMLPQPDLVQPGSNDESIGWFHWVIPTCPKRPNWGRFLSSLLLSALYHGMQPYSINIVMCQPYDPSQQLPAMLHNLQTSPNVNVFYPSSTFPINTSIEKEKQEKQYYWRTTVTCLLVPTMLNASHLPLFMTEDDTILSPKAQPSLHAAVYQITNDIPVGDAFYINTYMPWRTDDIDTSSIHDIRQPGAQAKQEGKAADFVIKRDIHWGFQGVMISGGMAELLVNHFIEVTSTPFTDDVFIGHADWLVMTYMRDKLKCNQQGASCHAYRLFPSLVQHIGTTSATFQNGKVNQGFHLAFDFPFKVEFPGLEPHTMWR